MGILSGDEIILRGIVRYEEKYFRPQKDNLSYGPLSYGYELIAENHSYYETMVSLTKKTVNELISEHTIYMPYNCFGTLHLQDNYINNGLILIKTLIKPEYKGTINISLFNTNKYHTYVNLNESIIILIVTEFA